MGNQNNPLVSIILSTYNGKKYISESIESVLNQSFIDFEFIIINDSSTDGVDLIIESYAKKDLRIKLLTNANNLGLTKSLNKGIEFSQGKYIARIDDDDIWEKDKLEKQVKFMEENPEYGLCGTGMKIIDQNGEIIKSVLMPETDKQNRNKLLLKNTFIHSSVIFRKDILAEVGLYDEKDLYVEDYGLWLRIGKNYKVYNLPEYLTQYRFLNTSISRNKYYKQRIYATKLSFRNLFFYPHTFRSFFFRCLKVLIPKWMSEIKNFN